MNKISETLRRDSLSYGLFSIGLLFSLGCCSQGSFCLCAIGEGWLGKVWSFHCGRRPLKDRFSGKAVGNPALGQKDEAGDILRTAVWRSVTPGLFRVEYILLSP